MVKDKVYYTRKYHLNVKNFSEISINRKLFEASQRRSMLQQPVFAEEHNYAAMEVTKCVEEGNYIKTMSRKRKLESRIFLARCRRLRYLDEVRERAAEMGSPKEKKAVIDEDSLVYDQ